jgi:hypothetical protein
MMCHQVAFSSRRLLHLLREFAPPNKASQRTTNSAAQLTWVAAWRHTGQLGRIRSALSLAAERRSVRQRTVRLSSEWVVRARLTFVERCCQKRR